MALWTQSFGWGFIKPQPKLDLLSGPVSRLHLGLIWLLDLPNKDFILLDNLSTACYPLPTPLLLYNINTAKYCFMLISTALEIVLLWAASMNVSLLNVARLAIHKNEGNYQTIKPWNSETHIDTWRFQNGFQNMGTNTTLWWGWTGY